MHIPPLLEPPPPDDWLPPPAAEIWKRLARELVDRRLLTVLDLSMLGILCAHEAIITAMIGRGETTDPEGLRVLNQMRGDFYLPPFSIHAVKESTDDAQS